MPCATEAGKKILAVSCQCALGKEGFSLPGSLILSTLERCMRGTLEGQRGEEACSETTNLRRGKGGPLRTEHFSSPFHRCLSQAGNGEGKGEELHLVVSWISI